MYRAELSEGIWLCVQLVAVLNCGNHCASSLWIKRPCLLEKYCSTYNDFYAVVHV